MAQSQSLQLRRWRLHLCCTSGRKAESWYYGESKREHLEPLQACTAVQIRLCSIKWQQNSPINSENPSFQLMFGSLMRSTLQKDQFRLKSVQLSLWQLHTGTLQIYDNSNILSIMSLILIFFCVSPDLDLMQATKTCKLHVVSATHAPNPDLHQALQWLQL